MTAGGWVFLIVSVGTVWSLAAWCYYRVLFGKRSAEYRQMHDPSE